MYKYGDVEKMGGDQLEKENWIYSYFFGGDF
jgi:hypothetical protein